MRPHLNTHTLHLKGPFQVPAVFLTTAQEAHSSWLMWIKEGDLKGHEPWLLTAPAQLQCPLPVGWGSHFQSCISGDIFPIVPLPPSQPLYPHLGVAVGIRTEKNSLVPDKTETSPCLWCQPQNPNWDTSARPGVTPYLFWETGGCQLSQINKYLRVSS